MRCIFAVEMVVVLGKTGLELVLSVVKRLFFGVLSRGAHGRLCWGVCVGL